MVGWRVLKYQDFCLRLKFPKLRVIDCDTGLGQYHKHMTPNTGKYKVTFRGNPVFKFEEIVRLPPASENSSHQLFQRTSAPQAGENSHLFHES